LEDVPDFKYLGSWSNSSEEDIKVRKCLAWKTLNHMSSIGNLHRDLKIRVFPVTMESFFFKGTYTRMLCSVLNTSWPDQVTNAEMYSDLPTLSDRIGFRRLGLAVYCYHHRELPTGQFVLWRPTHGHLRLGRSVSTFRDTLMRDAGAASTSHLSACMDNRADWAASRLARLRLPE